MSITVQIKSRSGRDLGSYEVAPSTTVTEFKKDFAKKNPKYYPSRQMFSFEQDGATIRLTEPDKHVIGDYKVKQGEVLTFKDLGAQVGWRTVFLVEYFGPILIHSLFYFFPSIFYGSSVKQRNPVATIGFACVVFHYVKRELETIFIHRFSAETMPFFNIFKNSAHYWVLSGLFIAYPLYHPKYTNSLPMTLVYAAVGVFLLGELGNFLSHVTLMNLRPAGTRTRGIPRGGLFELVSCANYTYELLAWLAFSYFSQCITAYLFFLVSAGQIWLWALKKHKRYIAEFPDYPRGRKALVPFLA